MAESNAIQMVGFVLPMREPKKVAFNIRMSESERAVFQKAADSDDQSLSDWFRRLGRKRAEELGLAIKSATKRASK